MSHSLDAAKFGSSDHSSKTRLGGGLIPVTPSTHGKWRRERRLGCPCWRWRRSRRWWRGRRTTHVHWRRYYWGGHGENSRVSLERRTWRESVTCEDADDSVSMCRTFICDLYDINFSLYQFNASTWVGRPSLPLHVCLHLLLLLHHLPKRTGQDRKHVWSLNVSNVVPYLWFCHFYYHTGTVQPTIS